MRGDLGLGRKWGAVGWRGECDVRVRIAKAGHVFALMEIIVRRSGLVRMVIVDWLILLANETQTENHVNLTHQEQKTSKAAFTSIIRQHNYRNTTLIAIIRG